MEGEITMKCGQCGAEVAKGETFCQVCGARVNSAAVEKKPEVESRPESKLAPTEEQPKEQKRSKKGGNKKLTVIAMIGILIAFVAVALTIVLAKMGRSTMMERDDSRPFGVTTEGVAGSGERFGMYSAEGECLASAIGEWLYDESDWNGTSALVDQSGRLTVATSKGAIEVTDSVYGAWVCADGSRVAYIKNYSSDHGDLYIYNVAKGTSTPIDTGVRDFSGVTMSPNGSTICYTAYDEASDAHHVRMSRGQKKGERVLDCEWVLAVTDDSSRMFFVNNNKVYEMIDGARTRICELDDIDAGINPMFNADCTEMLYQHSDAGAARIFTEGEEHEVAWLGYLRGEPLAVYGEGGFDYSKILRIDSFFGAAMWGYSGVGYENDEGQVFIPGIFADAAISEDGRRIAVADAPSPVSSKPSGGVKVYKISGKGAELEHEYAPENLTDRLYTSGKMDSVYCVNSKGELWQLKNGKLNMVSADVSMACMSGAGDLYFMYDGVVLCRADGSERISVERREGVTGIVAVPQGVAVTTTRDGTIYYRNGGEGTSLPVSVTEAQEAK